MIPTKEEQNKKYQELRIKYNFNNSMMNIQGLLDEYAKWYATEVIKHCTAVAKCTWKVDKDDFYKSIDMDSIRVDKQSILNVINEL